VRVKAAAEAEEHEAAERAMHWAAERDKALTYRRDIDRRDVVRREAAGAPRLSTALSGA
jgi:hypothetical protein